MRHEPAAPLLYDTVGTVGTWSQVTVILPGGLVKVGDGAGVTVMVLVTGARVLPHASVAVHVSVMEPPQGPGRAEKVEVLEMPVTRHDPVSPLL